MKAKRITKKTLSTLAARLGVTMDALLSHCRKAELVDARSMIVAIMIEHAHMRQQEVAPLLNITQSAVSWLLIRHRQMMKRPGGNPDYQQRFAGFVSVVESDSRFAQGPASRHCEEERRSKLD